MKTAREYIFQKSKYAQEMHSMVSYMPRLPGSAVATRKSPRQPGSYTSSICFWDMDFSCSVIGVCWSLGVGSIEEGGSSTRSWGLSFPTLNSSLRQACGEGSTTWHHTGSTLHCTHALVRGTHCRRHECAVITQGRTIHNYNRYKKLFPMWWVALHPV